MRQKKASNYDDFATLDADYLPRVGCCQVGKCHPQSDASSRVGAVIRYVFLLC